MIGKDCSGIHLLSHYLCIIEPQRIYLAFQSSAYFVCFLLVHLWPGGEEEEGRRGDHQHVAGQHVSLPAQPQAVQRRKGNQHMLNLLGLHVFHVTLCLDQIPECYNIGIWWSRVYRAAVKLTISVLNLDQYSL